jgi:glyoxylase-like metal-dependent hydrolase (beta-lactamase superfamily II)
MNQHIFPFKLGDFQCLAIRDTVSEAEEPTSLYPEITRAQYEQLYRQYHIQPSDSFDTICLLIRTGRRTILIDTGWGDSPRPNTGMLISNLQSKGISSQDIDIVINSHGHPDHIGGNTNAQGEPNFPHARYYIGRSEYEFWASNPELKEIGDKAPTILAFVKKNLFSIQDRFEVVEDEAEILPGVRFIRSPGHSPGHTACSITSGNERLISIGDVFHHPLGILNPRWRMCVDTSLKQTIDTRVRMLEMATSTGALIFGSHLPFPGLGHIVKQNAVCLWRPLQV